MQNGSVSSAKSNWGGGEGVACCSNWKTKRACAPGRLAARVRSEGGSGGKWPALAWSSMFWRSDSGAREEGAAFCGLTRHGATCFVLKTKLTHSMDHSLGWPARHHLRSKNKNGQGTPPFALQKKNGAGLSLVFLYDLDESLEQFDLNLRRRRRLRAPTLTGEVLRRVDDLDDLRRQLPVRHRRRHDGRRAQQLVAEKKNGRVRKRERLWVRRRQTQNTHTQREDTPERCIRGDRYALTN